MEFEQDNQFKEEMVKWTIPNPNYEAEHKKQLEVWNKIPQPIFCSEGNKEIEHKIKVYIDMSIETSQKQNQGFASILNSGNRYKKEQEDTLQKMQKEFDLQEFGSNFSPEVHDPKTIVKDQSEYYEGLAQKSMNKQNIPFQKKSGFQSQDQKLQTNVQSILAINHPAYLNVSYNKLLPDKKMLI